MDIDLLINYPKAKRNTAERNEGKSEEVRAIARQFGQAFFDGERQYGYGGFSYHPRFWQPVIPTLIEHFKLTSSSSLLDVGCAKGFMLYDLKQSLADIDAHGVDISNYAVEHAKPEVKGQLQVACATKLPFKENRFDGVISVNTVHNLEKEQCAIALQEIMRVSKGKAFITVDAFRDDEQEKRMYEWNLTAKTIMHVDQWVAFFKQIGYTGDYFWFVP
jgi:ubiquinone/menaquinone biosynthesis C-methylase UbiE